MDLAAEYIKNNEANNIRSACLLQFPYGVGDMNEKRILHDDSYSDKVDIELYLKHLAKLLQNVFQKPMF